MASSSLYVPDPGRYARLPYARCGRSGLMFPRLSLGLWHNFGQADSFDNARGLLRGAFDRGITHFDLANNYGPPYGSAEENLGKILRQDFSSLRDELLISTKAGYDMWPGPYGNWGSRKYLLASLDQSLRRLGLDYVDIFYSHRPDPETPVEETMGALDHAVRSGKALYVGLSNYSPAQTEAAAAALKRLGTPCLIHQPRYNMLDRGAEALFPVLLREGIGCIPFSPLAQGQLTARYLEKIPANSRAAKGGFLKADTVQKNHVKVVALAGLAEQRGQSLAQMALAWVLRQPAVTTVLIGASSLEQIEENCGCLAAPAFTEDELRAIDAACAAE